MSSIEKHSPSRVERLGDTPRYPVADPGMEEHVPRLTDV
ncbi:MAG: hypothetical protein QOF52_3485, partial [Propionibacteriaceae bacterium]|nr:hypothetical protein [Propionibacteriaceae bacterium]